MIAVLTEQRDLTQRAQRKSTEVTERRKKNCTLT